ncbi:MAG: hypothetical protein JKY24_06310 [Pseudomonadales bacterium]|nr:hypothetical protein [Pseudomonadales bacterium]
MIVMYQHTAGIIEPRGLMITTWGIIFTTVRIVLIMVLVIIRPVITIPVSISLITTNLVTTSLVIITLTSQAIARTNFIIVMVTIKIIEIKDITRINIGKSIIKKIGNLDTRKEGTLTLSPGIETFILLMRKLEFILR